MVRICGAGGTKLQMTEKLEEAIRAAKALPGPEQDAIAAAILSEIEARRTATGAPREFGSARGSIHMADDFEAPLEEFRDYM